MAKRWTQCEFDFVIAFYGDLTAEEIAKTIGRSEVSVRHKAEKMGLRSSIRNKEPPPVYTGKDHWNYREALKPYERKGRVWIKTAEKAIPMQYSRYMWEQNIGVIPEGHAIAHKDGNPLNCEIDNLECISRADLMARNSIAYMPEDFRDVIFLLRDVSMKIKRIEDAKKQTD